MLNSNTVVKINGLFGLIEVDFVEATGQLIYHINGEVSATEDVEGGTGFDHDEVKTKARFMLAGCSHGFAIGRLSA